MSELDDKNKDLKIRQTKNRFIKNIIICVAFLLIITIIFWVVSSNAQGKEVYYNDFISSYDGGTISEIYIGQSKIQYYCQDGSAYWFYNRDDVGQTIRDMVQSDAEAGLSTPKILLGTTTTISILNVLYPILLIVIFIVMIYFVMRQIRGANNKNFEFVKSRARVLPSKTKFSDVAGEDEEKQELEDVVDFLKNPKKYIEIGAKIPKGVLLVGPPGTGKTLLAKAVAGEANVPFFTISGSDFMELFVGVGASRVRDLFETAKKAKPCIIFIDEIDAVGRQRGAGLGGGNDEREQTLNQLLVQMDGFEENEGIIVMAATNRVDILDPALLRPGRFDRRVNINLPDIKGREEILKVHARNKPISQDVDFKTIARITAGFTGAEIENLLNEAAILVAKDNRKEIVEEDIQKSIMKVTLGPQKKSRVIDEKDKFDTAVHESGHALISKLAKEKSPVHEVSIIPRGGAGGYTLSTDDDSTVYFKEKLLCKIQMLLGGITAEKLYVGDISTGASNDLKRASSIARRMVTEWGMSGEVGMVYCGNDDAVFIGRSYQERVPYSEAQATKIDDEVKKIIDSCQKVTEKILTENKEMLLTMANVLLEKETIYAEEVDMIIAGKSKEEVISYIESKDKRGTTLFGTESKTDTKLESTDMGSETQVTEAKDAEDAVDKLIKLAELREKELQNNDSDASDEVINTNDETEKVDLTNSQSQDAATQNDGPTKPDDADLPQESETKEASKTKKSATTKSVTARKKSTATKTTAKENSEKTAKNAQKNRKNNTNSSKNEE